jgi:DNA phosphorothioation-dependent restriction protein DptH
LVEPEVTVEPSVLVEPEVTVEPSVLVEPEVTVEPSVLVELEVKLKDDNSTLHKMSHEGLERTYEILIKSLKDRGVSTFIPEDGEPYITEGPASVLYRLNLDYDTDPQKLDNRNIKDLMHLRFKLDESQQLRIYKHRGSMNIDVPKQPEERYFITAQWLWDRWKRPDSEIAVPLGINQRKEIIEINFSDSNSPHLLIGGTTGTGKSVALYTILRGLLEHYSSDELKLILVDPKQTELIEFEESPYLERPLGFNASDAEESLEKCVVEMEKRYRLFKEASRTHSRLVNSIKSFNKVAPANQNLSWWVIVLDEYADLIINPDDKKKIEQLLSRLAAKARASGIHIIIATQKPTVEVINSVLRSNLPAQLALTVKSGNESRVIMDDLGAESLSGNGDAFLKIGGKLNRLQCAMVADD